MADDPLSVRLEGIERALRREDPVFARQFRRTERRDTLNVVLVFALLASGTVLLTVGLAAVSIVAACTGAAAMVLSCLVERHHQRDLRRPPRETLPARPRDPAD
jgi:hypothetical protein